MTSENAERRKRLIFEEYEKIIHQYGPRARKMAKNDIYAEVADNLNYSVEWVRKVIASFLKDKR